MYVLHPENKTSKIAVHLKTYRPQGKRNNICSRDVGQISQKNIDATGRNASSIKDE